MMIKKFWDISALSYEAFDVTDPNLKYMPVEPPDQIEY